MFLFRKQICLNTLALRSGKMFYVSSAITKYFRAWEHFSWPRLMWTMSRSSSRLQFSMRLKRDAKNRQPSACTFVTAKLFGLFETVSFVLASIRRPGKNNFINWHFIVQPCGRQRYFRPKNFNFWLHIDLRNKQKIHTCSTFRSSGYRNAVGKASEFFLVEKLSKENNRESPKFTTVELIKHMIYVNALHIYFCSSPKPPNRLGAKRIFARKEDTNSVINKSVFDLRPESTALINNSLEKRSMPDPINSVAQSSNQWDT